MPAMGALTRAGLLAGRYQILGPLAEGGQARVHHARDTLLGDEVVIKALRPGEEDALRRELAVLGRLRHPNLVAVVDLLLVEGERLLVQSYAPGPDLVRWAREEPGPARVALGAAAALRALAHLHRRGIVHRDVKPAHLRVGPGLIGALPAVRLVDLGLAAQAPEPGASGTAGYMAPEVLAGEPATPAADLYSLGVVLGEALGGEPGLAPHGVPDRWLPPLPGAPGLREVIRDLLAPRPADRPGARALLAALAEVAGRPLELSALELRGAYAPQPPLVGREAALARIDEALEVVRAGASRALQLTGCGKTALAREAVLRGRLAGLQTISHSGLPLLAPAGEAEAPERLATRLVDALLERGSTTPLLLERGSTTPLLLERGSMTPVLLDLDGAAGHPLATALVVQLGSLVARGAVGSLLMLWSGELPAGTEGFAELPLPPLGPAASLALVHGMTEQDDVPWAAEAHVQSGGDPRLLAPLVRAQLEAGLPDRLVPPPPRLELAARRLAGLTPGERAALAVLACSPRPLGERELAEVAEGAAGVLPALVARGLVLVDERGCTPADVHVRRAALPELEAERRRLHGRLARLAEAVRPPIPAVLGHHLLEAGEVPGAVAALLAAPDPDERDLERAAGDLGAGEPLRLPLLGALARRARARGELERALALAAAVTAEQPAEGTLLEAELLVDAGRPAAALEALARRQPESPPDRDDDDAGRPAALAREQPESPADRDDPRRALLGARAHFLVGDHAAAVLAARGALEQELEVRLRAQLCNLAGLALTYRGEVGAGLELLREAERLAAGAGDRETRARALSSLGIALERRGELGEAARALGEASSLGRVLGDLRLAAGCTLNLGTIAHRRLELGDALEHYRAAGALARRGRLGATAGWAVANEANLLLLCGEHEQADRLLREAEAIAGAAGATAQLGHVHLYRAELLLARGDPSGAQEAVVRARGCFGEADTAGRDAADLLEGELLVRSPVPGAAAAAGRLAAALCARMPWDGPDRWRAHLLAGQAALAAAPPDHAAAARHLHLALALAGQGGGADRAFELHALLAACAAALGSPEEASLHAGRCLKLLDELRRRVPPASREAFDRRAEVRGARACASQVPRAITADEPSAAELARVLEINKDLNQPLPADRLLERILDGAVELTGAERGFVLLRQGSERLAVAASRNIDGEAVRRGMDKFSKSIAQQAIEEDSPVIAADALEDERFRARLSVHGLRLRAVLCVPLRVRGEVRGALYVDNRFHADAFRPGHARLMQAFAEQAGIALENARLLGEAAEQREALAAAKAEAEALARELESQVARQSQELSEIAVRLRAQEEELIRRYSAARIVGRSKPIRELFLKLDRVAEGDVPVFIHGESGTGKELVARAIHYTGPRRDHPFVTLNCGAVPPSLLESELFGHARGAFTGALRDRPGLFEVAGAGTLLLDEVGDMPAEMQVKLLRILQEATFRRVGEEQERQSRCRVLSASHQRLADLVADGRFREDLFYRLNVIELAVPPLRERGEDIPLLVEHILAAAKKRVTVAPRALAALLDYRWPGNVRQLENELQRAILLCDSRIDLEHLSIPTSRAAAREPRVRPQGLAEALREHERRLIEAALAEAEGNVSAAAARLGVHRVALHRKLRGLGIVRGKQR